MYKLELIETLLHRTFRLCSSYENFHLEFETLKVKIQNTIITPTVPFREKLYL